MGGEPEFRKTERYKRFISQEPVHKRVGEFGRKLIEIHNSIEPFHDRGDPNWESDLAFKYADSEGAKIPHFEEMHFSALMGATSEDVREAIETQQVEDKKKEIIIKRMTNFIKWMGSW